MYIQFSLALLEAVKRSLGSQALTALGIDPKTEQVDVSTYGILEIETCPGHVEGSITSNVCFRLSKLIADGQFQPSSEEIDPEELARGIAASFAPGAFELHVGGRGYLNASCPPAYSDEMLAAFLRSGGSGFFSGASVFNLQGRIPIDWNLLGAYFRLSAKADPETKRLLDERRSLDDRLMLLSLLADEELDVEVYRRKLNGRQNTPWYVRRYLHDVGRYLEFLENISPDARRVDPGLAALAVPTEELLLKFRHELIISARVDRPERFLLELLSIARDFYRIFNDPRMRAMTAFPLSTESRAYLSALLGLGRELMVQGLECLFGDEMKEILQ